MDILSLSTVFYVIDNLILPLGSTFLVLFFLLFLAKMVQQDQKDIFRGAEFMEPKQAREYLAKKKKERIENEFEMLLNYKKLYESHKKDFIKLREDGFGIKEIVSTLNPEDDNKK